MYKALALLRPLFLERDMAQMEFIRRKPGGNMFDIRLLTSFIAVGRHKHFGKAAAAINATQPGVSQHIAKLEEQLGFLLLERTKRSVMLTPAGEVFFERAKELFAALQRMEEEARQVAAGSMGHIAIGITSWVIFTEIPNRISKFRIKNPNITMRFHTQGGDVLKRMMDEGVLDIIISPLPFSSAEHESTLLTQQQMGVALPSRHPLNSRRSLTLHDLKRERFIVVPREYDPLSHDKLVTRMHTLGLDLKISAYETPSINALVRVAMGEGIAIVPMGFSSERREAVHIVKLNDPALDTGHLYATVAKSDRQPLATRLLNALV